MEEGAAIASKRRKLEDWPGRRLTEYRERKGITQAQLAASLNCSVALLSAVENGHCRPVYPRIVSAMHRIAGIRPAEWFDAD